MIDFNAEAAIVHQNNHKWWINIHTGEPLDRNKGELLMLVVTELAEAAEGIRKNLMDDHLPHRKMAEVEIADAFIRMLDFAGGFKYELNNGILNELLDINIEEAIYQYDLPENKLEGLLDVVEAVTILKEAARWPESNPPEDIAELTTIVIFSIIAFARQHDYDWYGAYVEKNEYNKTRKDHSIEERLKENGKKI